MFRIFCEAINFYRSEIMDTFPLLLFLSVTRDYRVIFIRLFGGFNLSLECRGNAIDFVKSVGEMPYIDFQSAMVSCRFDPARTNFFAELPIFGEDGICEEIGCQHAVK